jgi:hypothetical protein
MSRQFVADAHRDNGKRFVMRADELLTAFVELETAARSCGGGSRLNHISYERHGKRARTISRRRMAMAMRTADRIAAIPIAQIEDSSP